MDARDSSLNLGLKLTRRLANYSKKMIIKKENNLKLCLGDHLLSSVTFVESSLELQVSKFTRKLANGSMQMSNS